MKIQVSKIVLVSTLLFTVYTMQANTQMPHSTPSVYGDFPPPDPPTSGHGGSK